MKYGSNCGSYGATPPYGQRPPTPHIVFTCRQNTPNKKPMFYI